VPLRISTFVAFCALLASTSIAQDVVFSHRVYAASGRTYQQLWSWSIHTGALMPISRGPRDHHSPMCERDGRHVIFSSEDADGRGTRWRVDRATGAESRLDVAEPVDTHGGATASEMPPACDEGTARLSPDRTRVACAVKGTDILIADAHSLQEIARLPFAHDSTGEPYPPWPLDSQWSPDGRVLLVGTYGELGSSTVPQLDYFLLDVSAHSWSRGFTGNDAIWLTPELIAFVTPRDLSPLAGGSHSRSVWTAHLSVFDVHARTSRALTSGLSNDLTPALCAPSP
jgi:hypothetical protein